MQRLTTPYTPEQNGLNERENRSIVEMARTFMYSNEDAQFPKPIWAELVRTSVYILNRTGGSAIEDKSPYELWFGKAPRIEHMNDELLAQHAMLMFQVRSVRKWTQKL